MMRTVYIGEDLAKKLNVAQTIELAGYSTETFMESACEWLDRLENMTRIDKLCVKDNYGFGPDDVVHFKAKPYRLDFDLTPKSAQSYDWLCEQTSVPAIKFAETVASIINDSFTYEFSIIRNNYKSTRVVAAVEYYDELQRNYVPPPKDYLRGMCADSGNFIRKVLNFSYLEEPFKFAKAATSRIYTSEKDSRWSATIGHDVTILYTPNNWLLLNSLSLSNPRPFLTLDDLKDVSILVDEMKLQPDLEGKRESFYVK